LRAPTRSGGCRFRRRRNDDLAPELFHRLDRGLRRALDLDGERQLELALGEEPHAIAEPVQNSGGDERGTVDGRIGLERAGFKRLLQAAEIDDAKILAEHLVVEAALGQAAMERRLAALEAVERDAGTRRLALAAAAAGLALARADAAPDALRAVMGAGIVLDLVELHRPPSRDPSRSSYRRHNGGSPFS
jgi:hypothetical protein